MLNKPVPMRIALHKHPGVKGVVEAGTELLHMVPGIEIVDLQQPAVGLMSNSLNALPEYKRGLQLAELEAAEAAGVDALVAIYHVDHRELCAHERDWPFRIINILDIVGASMGLHHDDHFKRLKIMQDADAIVADCKDMIAAYRDRSGSGARSRGQGDACRAAAAVGWEQELTQVGAGPISPAHDDAVCSNKSPPPPCHLGTGALSRVKTSPVPPELRPRHMFPDQIRAVGLLPVVL